MRISCFLPSSSSAVHGMLGGTGTWAAMPELTQVDEATAVGSPSYTVLTGNYETPATWASVPLPAGRPIADTAIAVMRIDRIGGGRICAAGSSASV